jgi:hypothetical protein
MTTVNISGTWSEKQRPNNGLERVAGYVHGNRLARIPVVGYIEFHQYTEKLNGNVLTVAIPAIEPALDADGADPTGAGEQIWQILDQLRKDNGKGAVADTLFSVPRDGFDFDGPGGEGGSTAEMDGQQELRLGPDGPHPVPEASAEELMAERAEAAAAADEAPAEADPAPAPAPASAPARKRTRAATTDPFTPDGDAA